jgi:hypothetical protein
MRVAPIVLGVGFVIAGIVFIGQGSGYFPYPASSFMIREANWIYYGGAIAVIGLILIFIGRR